MERTDEEPCEYILRARQMVIEDRYDEAFKVLVEAFRRVPSLVAPHEGEFCAVLLMLNTVLDSTEGNRLSLIFDNFSKALEIFPNNPLLLNDIGKYLYKYGCHKQALKQFEHVTKISPTFVNAEKNVNSLKNLLVERWHYRMLNDNLRNECYRQAIHQVVLAHEDRVVDVGTGTGLLAIYAAEAGAVKTIGCDGSKVMCEIAKNIIRSNCVKKINIVNKMSTSLSARDFRGKFSVLVTEMFDAGLFGEHVLQMLAHAWPTFLSSGATVVPNSAEFFVAGVNCDHLSLNYKLSAAAKQILNIPLLDVHVNSTKESYDCEDVHLIRDIKYLTEHRSVMKVDFNDPEDIVNTLMRNDPFNVELIATDSGVMNIVIGWFNLYLSKTVTITTNPLAPDRANAWQQAVFYDDVPRLIKKDEKINIKFLMNGGNLTMVPTSDSLITRVSPEMIKFLNDIEYVNMIKECVPLVCENLSKITGVSEICVMDQCPFPVLGLELLKLGTKSLMCFPLNENDKEFIIKVCQENGIPEAKLSFMVGDEWTAEDLGEKRYHVIFSHMLELCGDVDMRRYQAVEHMTRHQLEEGGVLLPRRLAITAQLASSHWLDLNNRLRDDNVSDYSMSIFLNRYKVSQNFSIDFSTLKYVAISNPTVVCDYLKAQKCEKMPVKVISDGFANAILCWYDLQLMEGLREISTNRPNGFIDGTLFMTYTKEELIAGNMVNIVFHQDSDGSFKLIMDI